MRSWPSIWSGRCHFKRRFRWGVKDARDDTRLTDAHWAYRQPLLPKAATRGRPATDRRRRLEAIRYLVKWGCPWRYLPADFPPWQTG